MRELEGTRLKSLIVPLLLLSISAASIAAKEKKEWPFHGKITGTGKAPQQAIYTGTGLGEALGAGWLKTLSITIAGGKTFVVEEIDGGKEPDEPTYKRGDEVDFRVDAKEQHAWIRWTRKSCTAAAPCTNFGDGGGVKKEMEEKFDIVNVSDAQQQ
jgi:hypothetical protein